jgi:hypothetical protein
MSGSPSCRGLVVRARDLGDAGRCGELRDPAERGPGAVTDILAILAGDTGASVFDGGLTAMSAVNSIQTPIVAQGRIFVASNGQIYAWKPVGSARDAAAQ